MVIYQVKGKGGCGSECIPRSAPASPRLRRWLRRWLHSWEAKPCGLPILPCGHIAALLRPALRALASPAAGVCVCPPWLPPACSLRFRRSGSLTCGRSIRSVARSPCGAPLRGATLQGATVLTSYVRGKATFFVGGLLVACAPALSAPCGARPPSSGVLLASSVHATLRFDRRPSAALMLPACGG